LLFRQLVVPQKSDRLLDVGGYPEFWTPHPPLVRNITALNLHAVIFDPSHYPEHNITVSIGDGCKLNIPDKSYDIAFSKGMSQTLLKLQ